MNTLIIHAKIVTENKVIEQGYLRMVKGVIQEIGDFADIEGEMLNQLSNPQLGEVIDAQGSWLLPGFIDVHVHGGYGADFMDAKHESIDAITSFHAKHGTTAMLATTMTAPREALTQVLEAVHTYCKANMAYAQVLGVHLEGPFISTKWPGAQNASHITLPRRDWLEDWHERYPGLVRIVTLAPECEGSLELVGWLTDHGIVPACGHTDATLAEMHAARRQGLTHAVHAYNAMRGLHHREPGVVGAILTDSALSAEVIADGHHVHPAAIRLLVHAKAPDHLLLITDAMAAAGLGDGSFQLGGLSVEVESGIARLAGQSTLAGSTLTMIDAFRYMVQQVGVSIPEASRFASLNPARLIDKSKSMGSIAVGKQADLVLLDNQLSLKQIWILGRKQT